MVFNSDDVLLSRHNDDLRLTLRTTGKFVTVQNFFKGSEYEIDQVKFADGTTWDSAYLKVMLIPLACSHSPLALTP